MAQFDFGVIDPNQYSGTQLADALEQHRDAVHSSHSGQARPSYVVAGMQWLDTSGANDVLKFYTGSTDIVIAEMRSTGARAADATSLNGRAASDYLSKHQSVSGWDLAGLGLFWGSGGNEDSLHYDESTNTFWFRGDAPSGDMTAVGSSIVKGFTADFFEWRHAEGLRVRGISGVNGISVGTEAVDPNNSGRLFLESDIHNWALVNWGGELGFAAKGTYGSSTGTTVIRFRADGSIFAPNAEGLNVAGGDDLCNRNYNDARYQQDSRLAAEVTVLFAGGVGNGEWFRAATGHVVTGIRIHSFSGDERVSGLATRPVQKFINGAWVTVAQS